MNLTTVLVGAALIAYGGYTFWARRARPATFRKLEPMKALWGEKPGQWIHVIGYSVLPVVLGLLLLRHGWLGGSVF
jgi:hypothetical protein